MRKLFTEKEIEVARLKLKGLMNKKVAEELNVSEAYISQTITNITKKVKTVQDSIELLKGMNVIQEGPKYRLTAKGRRLSRLPKARKLASPKFLKWYDFKTKWDEFLSTNFDIIWGYGLLGQQSIKISGISEVETITLNKTIKKTTSSIEDTPPEVNIGIPERIVLPL